MRKQKRESSLLALSVVILALVASACCMSNDFNVFRTSEESVVLRDIDSFLAEEQEPFHLENSPSFVPFNGTIPANAPEHFHQRIAPRSVNSLDIRITYTDAAGVGFNDPTNGAARKACVLHTLGYLNSFFDINPSNVNKRWNVAIGTTTTGASQFGQAFYDDQVFAKSYAQRAIVDGEVINGNPDTIHSVLTFNFVSVNFLVPTCTDPRTVFSSPQPTGTQRDFIQAILRASALSLGINTNLRYAANDCPGANPVQSTTVQTVIGTCSPSVNYATSFDRNLGDRSGVSYFSGAPSDDTFTGPPNAAISTRVTFNGPKTLAATEGKGITMFSPPPFSPVNINFFNNSAVLSNNLHYVLRISIDSGTVFRTFAPAELAVFEDLGYTILKDFNDECQFATPVGLGKTTFQIDDATASPVPPDLCVPAFSKDLWFAFTAETDGVYTFSTCESTFNTSVIINTRCDISITNFPTCDQRRCGNGRAVRFLYMSAGEIYYLRIGAAAGATGTGVLDISVSSRCDAAPFSFNVPTTGSSRLSGLANFLIFNRFTFCAPSFTLDSVAFGLFIDPTNGLQNGDSYSVYVWQNLGGDGNPLSGYMNLIYMSDSTINTGSTGNIVFTHTISPALSLTNEGDFYIGFVGRHTRGNRVSVLARQRNNPFFRSYRYAPLSLNPLGVDPLSLPFNFQNIDATFFNFYALISPSITAVTPLPSFSFSSALSAVPENGDSITVFFFFEGNLEKDVPFSFEISGTAVLGTHYTTNIPGGQQGTNSAVFTANSIGLALIITPINDPSTQVDRTIILTITPNPSVYSLGKTPTQTITLTNVPPLVSFTLDRDTVPEGAGPAIFTLSRVQTSTPVFVKIDVSGSATFGSDYSTSLLNPGENTIVIPSGQASASFTVKPRPDLLTGESSETVVVTIIPDASYIVDGASSQTLTITNRASGSGDPHMVGFHGQVFDYIGVAGQVINMLTDPDLQVNALLGLQRVGVNAFMPGPVMMEMAFMTRSHTITINAGGSKHEETGFVVVDGVLLPIGQSFLDGILSVSFSALSASSKEHGLSGDDYLVGQANVKLEGMYEFTIFFIENGKDHLHHTKWLTEFPRRFLDFNASLLDLDLRPHGVLGQTAAPLAKDRSVGEWSIEGKDEDYVVKDGLTGTQFTFNKF